MHNLHEICSSSTMAPTKRSKQPVPDLKTTNEDGDEDLQFIPHDLDVPTGELPPDLGMHVEPQSPGSASSSLGGHHLGRSAPFEVVPASVEGYKTFGLHQLEGFEGLKWIVDGLFHLGSIVMVWGPSGAGKTAWLIDLMLAISARDQWAGRPVHNVGVLYCAMEGSEGFRNRVLAAVEYHDIRPSPSYRLRFLFEPIDLADDESLVRLAASVDKYSSQLIIIDTLAAALAGKMDESSNRDMAAVIQNAKRLSWATGATVLLTHHTGHNESHERGATAMRGGVDTSISIKRRKDERYWTVEKQRDGEEGFGGWFELVAARVPGRPDWSSVVVRHGKPFTSDEAPSSRRTKKSSPGGKKRGAGGVAAEQASRTATKSSVKAPTALQSRIIGLLEQLWMDRTKDKSTQEIGSVSFSLAEAQQACRTVSTYYTRDVKRAIEYFEKSGRLEQLADGGIRFVGMD